MLLHVTSLPGSGRIGDLGPASYEWVDRLRAAGLMWWQMLPLTPPGEGNSPYSARSAFAGNPLLISPELLARDGLLDSEDLSDDATTPSDRVDFARASKVRSTLLARAGERFMKGGVRRLRSAYDRFRAEERSWLDDYALFHALKTKLGWHLSWTRWPVGLARRKQAALADARRELASIIDQTCFEQFLFYRHLKMVRSHAHRNGVRLLGDLPIYVSAESADVWANPKLFQLDRALQPKHVAGVPPDLFSAVGQRWGNPLYDWSESRRSGHDWWIRRIRQSLRQADLVRIDHFRGLAGYWSIPASAPTAQTGRWRRGPGAELLSAVGRALGQLPLVAEDLGVITPDVESLRDDFGLPGMHVLHFAFTESDSPSLPHRHRHNAIVYTGTHDNDTTLGWHASLPRADRRTLHGYAPDCVQDPAWGLIRLAVASVADVAIVPVQDLLSMGREARMNRPGRAVGNWAWRLLPEAPTVEVLARLGELASVYSRRPGQEGELCKS